jgi:hypothetical protein
MQLPTSQQAVPKKLNLFKIFTTGIPNITIMIEEREIDNNDQKSNIATTLIVSGLLVSYGFWYGGKSKT